MVEKIAEHYVDTSLLNGGICIDVGCLGFEFSSEMKRRGLKVYAFDLAEMLEPEGVHFIKAAVRPKSGRIGIVKTADRQGWWVTEVSSSYPVEAIALSKVYELAGGIIDCLKIDAEGSEYQLLSDENFKPIPKQISVEFHMHCCRSIHDIYYEKCMENLLMHYKPVVHELTEAHGLGFNYWSSLFVRKDLL